MDLIIIGGGTCDVSASEVECNIGCGVTNPLHHIVSQAKACARAGRVPLRPRDGGSGIYELF